MNKLIGLLVFIVSCGIYQTDPNWSDLGDEVDQSMVDLAILETELAYERIYDEPISFDDLNYTYPIYVEYQANLTNESGEEARGITYNYHDVSSIYINYKEEDSWGSCVDLYYVLTHELLHYLANINGYSQNDNHEHNVPYFVQWGMDQKIDLRDTVEFWTYYNISKECKLRWPDDQS